MNLKIAVILFLMVISRNVFCQIGFIDNLTNWMGNWESTFKISSGETCKENLNIDWGYHNRFIKFDISGSNSGNSNYIYYSIEYITFNIDKQIAGFYMTDAGYDQLASITGNLKDEKVFLKLVSKTENFEEIWEYRDGKLHRTHNWKDEKTGMQETMEVIFNKKL